MNETVKVSIKRDENGEIQIEHTQPLPSTTQVWANMEKKYKNNRTKNRISYCDLQTAIDYTKDVIPFQVWADAISGAQVINLANAAGATSELHHMAEGGYLALGSTIYKLSAVGMAPQTKALSVTRRKMHDKVAGEISSMKESAQQTTDALIASGQEVRQAALEFQREVEEAAGAIPPKWLFQMGYPFKYDRYDTRKWNLQIVINFSIKYYDVAWSNDGELFKYSWKANDDVPPTKIHLWVPIKLDGSYTATGIYVDETDPELPHISYNSGCMGLAGAPKVLKTGDDVLKLKDALEFAHSRVNLCSLFTHRTIVTTFAQFLPEELKTAFTNAASYKNAAITLAKQKKDLEKTTWEKEEKSTWKSKTA